MLQLARNRHRIRIWSVCFLLHLSLELYLCKLTSFPQRFQVTEISQPFILCTHFFTGWKRKGLVITILYWRSRWEWETLCHQNRNYITGDIWKVTQTIQYGGLGRTLIFRLCRRLLDLQYFSAQSAACRQVVPSTLDCIVVLTCSPIGHLEAGEPFIDRNQANPFVFAPSLESKLSLILIWTVPR